MKSRSFCIAPWFLVALLGFLPKAASASFDGHPKIALHNPHAIFKNPCGVARGYTDCQNMSLSTSGLLYPSPYNWVFVLVDRGNLASLGSAEFAIDYQDSQPSNRDDGQRLDIFAFSLCATTQSQPDFSWTSPGVGNTITWDSTWTSQTCVAGYFYVTAYTPDTLQIVPVTLTGQASVSDAHGNTVALNRADLGACAFSASASISGCNPCTGPCPFVTPAHPTTWSGIKLLEVN